MSTASRLHLLTKHVTTSAMESTLNLQSTFRLNSGYEIPVLGFGVYRTPADACKEVVLEALKVGYRHIDSAVAYRNEKFCGEAIRESGIPRSEIFFTTKIPVEQMGYEKAKATIDNSLVEAGQEYFDLILIHAPYGGKEARLGTWKALIEAQKAGKVRSIGVSNFGVRHLDELEEYIKSTGSSPIDVGQYELHPWLARPDIVNWLNERKVLVQAYCPVVRGQKFDDPAVKALSEKYKKTPAQILLRWSLQKGFNPLPKSATASRIKENTEIYNFELTAEEMKSLHTEDYSPIAWDPTVTTD